MRRLSHHRSLPFWLSHVLLLLAVLACGGGGGDDGGDEDESEPAPGQEQLVVAQQPGAQGQTPGQVPGQMPVDETAADDGAASNDDGGSASAGATTGGSSSGGSSTGGTSSGGSTDGGSSDGPPPPPPDQAPTWDSTIGDQTVAEDAALAGLAAAATDPDGDTVSYSLDAAASTCDDGAFSPAFALAADGTLSGTPTNDDVGTCSITIEATANGKTISQSLTLTITNTDDAPTWDAQISDFNVDEDAAISGQTIAASDVDVGETATYGFDAANSTCDEADFDPAVAVDSVSGALTGTPRFGAVESTCSMRFTATSNGVTISHDATITIDEPNPYALLTATASTSGANLHSTAAALSWATASFTTGYFNHDGGTPENLQFKTAGDYLVHLTMPMSLTGDCNNERCLVRSDLQLDSGSGFANVPAGLAASGYIRNNSGNNTTSSNHLVMHLKDVQVDDLMRIMVSDATGNVGDIGTPGIRLYVEYLPSTRATFAATATELVGGLTDFTQTALTAISWANQTQASTGFVHDPAGANPEAIQLSEAGYYLVHANLPYEATCPGSSDRRSIQLKVQLDDSTVTGGTGAQGYNRCYQGHNLSSTHWSGLVHAATADQVLTVKVINETDDTNATNLPAGAVSSIYVERLDSLDKVTALQASAMTGSDNWNPDTTNTVSWATQTHVDTDYFAAPGDNGDYEIKVERAGDYHLIYGDHLGSAVQRANPAIQVVVAGTPVTGGLCRSHYIRNLDDHAESSCALSLFLPGLNAGDVITIEAIAEAVSGSVDDLSPAMLFLQKK